MRLTRMERVTAQSEPRLQRQAVALWQRLVDLLHPYRPYKHYMRGPGPKTLLKIGEMLRAETEGITREPLPQRWLDLLQSLEKQQAEKSRSGQGGPPAHAGHQPPAPLEFEIKGAPLEQVAKDLLAAEGVAASP
jgi:hypothetical protein